MFKNIKMLKELKNEFQQIEFENGEIINENDEALIYVKAENKDDLVSKLSEGEDTIITSDFARFVNENTDNIKLEKHLNIKINNTKEFTREDKSMIKLAYRNYFEKKVSDINDRLYSNKVECIYLMILSVLALGLYALIKIVEKFSLFSEMILIIAWVFVWRTTENIFFERSKLRKEAIKYYKLLNARIDFYN
ncbi:MAG: hypothetical protein ACI4T1_01055 [Christensenellales bacterium]